MTTQEFEALLKEFNAIIIDQKVEMDKQKKGIGYFKARIVLKDKSCLALYEALNEGSKKYGYQWMREDNSLIICWDNAEHHPEISTHPDHKHEGTRQNVQASQPMSLEKVLDYISKIIGIILFFGLIFYFL